MLTAAFGIAAVVSSISILYGGRYRMRQDMSRLGLDIILIENKPSIMGHLRKTPRLNFSDLDSIKTDVPGLEVSSIITSRTRVHYPKKDLSKIITVIGTDESIFKMYDLSAIKGRYFTAKDIAQKRNVCVVDQALAEGEFQNGGIVGDELVLKAGDKELRLKVIGVMKDPYSVRTPQRQMDTASAARNILKSRLKFRNIYIPVTLIGGETGELNAIMIKTGDHRTVDEIQARLEDKFDGMPVKIWSHKSWIMGTLEYMEDITAYTNVIWIIILGVASVMIVTITLVSVRERYYEIAIRITEGATRAKIVLQFALENMMLTLTGGIVGIGLGHLFNALIRAFVIRWDPIFSSRETIFVLALSVFVGIATSIIPARKAAGLKPVDVFRMG
jgi:ABC-type antimicrobial peptide transport system permease subunit